MDCRCWPTEGERRSASHSEPPLPIFERQKSIRISESSSLKEDDPVGAFEVSLRKFRSELIGEYSLGLTFGESAGVVVIQAVRGRYARQLKPGLEVLRIDGEHPVSSAVVQRQLATSQQEVKLVVGSSLEMQAKELEQAARELEPSTTELLQAVALEHGGELVGLDFRFKTRASLMRKLLADLEAANRKQLDLIAAGTATDEVEEVHTADIVYAISDALRYTVLLPDEQYVDGVGALNASLQQGGYTIERSKNFWSEGDAYQGLNLAVESEQPLEEGARRLRFEVQVHTPESFEMKMGLGHRLYEEFRVTRDPITKLQVWEKAVAAANEVPVPEGVLSIPTLCTQPQPDEIRLYAELLLFVSQGAEKTVTAAMHDLFHRATGYPQLAGLCDVLKAPASSARKMQEVCHLREGRDEAPLSAREVSQRLEDALRYTVLFEASSYCEEVELALKKLGGTYTHLGGRNMWAESSDLLQGYYAYYCTEVGAGRRAVFEVQFHTPASYQLKETQVDELIVEMREAAKPAERARLVRRACKIWHTIPVPDGAETLPDESPLLALDEGTAVALLDGH